MKRILSAVLAICLAVTPLTASARTGSTKVSAKNPDITMTLQGEWIVATKDYYPAKTETEFGMTKSEWIEEAKEYGFILEALRADYNEYIMVSSAEDDDVDWSTLTDAEWNDLIQYDVDSMSDDEYDMCYDVFALDGENASFLVEDFYDYESDTFMRLAYTVEDGYYYQFEFMGYMTTDDYPTVEWDEILYFTDFTYSRMKTSGTSSSSSGRGIPIFVIIAAGLLFGTVVSRKKKQPEQNVTVVTPSAPLTYSTVNKTSAQTDSTPEVITSSEYLTDAEKTGPVSVTEMKNAEAEADWLAQELKNEQGDINLKL